MAGAPQYKVYGPSKIYQAATKEVEAAAALVALYGDGATVAVSDHLSDAFHRECTRLGAKLRSFYDWPYHGK